MIAYIDPGMGSFAWQIVAAMGLGSLFYSKKAWLWIKAKFVRSKETNQ